MALSGDGNTAIVGGPSDDKTTGATWVFVRSGGVWSSKSTSKLVGTRAHRASESGVPLGQGMSVALSADGNTAIVGGWVPMSSGDGVMGKPNDNRMVRGGGVTDPGMEFTFPISA